MIWMVIGGSDWLAILVDFSWKWWGSAPHCSQPYVCLSMSCVDQLDFFFQYLSYIAWRIVREFILETSSLLIWIDYFRLRELENQLLTLEASKPSTPPALKFKVKSIILTFLFHPQDSNMVFFMQVENFFCMGSPLAVFLALRGIRPGSSCHQDHILPTTICSRLFNVFHPTDPVVSLP